jgi:3,4-dehydroadipyl-CoA semialdehyde dehydrogenase
MGPLACLAQRDTVEQGIAALSRIAERVTPAGPFQPLGADVAAGAFVAPTLFRCRDALAETSQQIHDLEVFGPVATVIPYESEEQAYDLAGRGKGSLVTSVFSADEPYLARAALRLAAGHGRVLCVGASIGKTHTGHGNAMPQCLHGGPGRAGNGEELGGLRALLLFHRRSVIQGTNDLATRLGAVACRWNV